MHKIHLTLTIFNLFSFALVTVLYFFQANDIASNLLVVGFFCGYFANLLAVFISACLIAIYIYRVISKTNNGFMKKHWLGLFNGFFVVIFWSFTVFIIGYHD